MLGLFLCVSLAACSAGRTPAPSPTAEPTAAAAPTTVATPTGPITITYWETDTDDADVLLDELAAEFMKANPAITVKRAHYSYDDLRNEFRAKSFNGQPPELVRAPGEFAGPFSELKIVRPLDEIFSKDSLDQYFTGALAGVVAQRLVRQVCPLCAEDVPLTADEVAELGVPHPEDHAGQLLARRGQGCAKCRYTGYYGRTGLFELLPINGRLRHLIAEGATPEVLHRTARQDGLRGLRDHAIRKVASGVTSFEEAMRSTADAEGT